MLTEAHMSIAVGIRRFAAAGVGSVLLASGLVAVTAGQANAAIPVCTKTVQRTQGVWSGPVPAASNGSPNCQLGPGNSGSAVRALQTALKRCNNADPGVIDGIYGSNTRAAVTKVQRARGVTPADGLYGPKTRDAMDWVFTSNLGAACVRI